MSNMYNETAQMVAFLIEECQMYVIMGGKSATLIIITFWKMIYFVAVTSKMGLLFYSWPINMCAVCIRMFRVYILYLSLK